MELSQVLLSSLYIVNFIYIAYLFLKEKRDIIGKFLLLLGVSIMTISNVPIIIYNYFIGGTGFYFDLSYDSIFKGIIINFVFLLTWQLGFLLGLNLKISPRRLYVSDRQFNIGIFFLFLSFIFYAYVYSQSHSYAYTADLYSKNLGSTEANSFGTIGSFKNLFVPIIAALLVVYYQRKVAGEISRRTKKSFIIFLWILLIAAVFIGLTQDLQRGDIIKPLIFMAIIMLIRGLRPKFILWSMGMAGLALFIISPFIDILRLKNLYNKEVSIENIIDATNNTRALESVHISSDGIFSLTNILTQVARKNILPKTSAALAKYADREGFVFFKTYPSILVDIIPRAIYPSKPYALSINNTRASTAMAIAATESGQEGSVFWEVGAGTLYWQFWWIGVIFGGFIVGLLWSITFKYAFYGGSFLFLVLALGNLRWGLPMIYGIDNYFLMLVRSIKPITVFFIMQILIFSILDNWSKDVSN